MKDFVQILALMMLVYIAATSLRMYKQNLLEMVSGLVNRAEEAIQGSIVAALNASGAWLATQAKQAANGLGADDSGAKKPAEKTGGGNV